MGAREFEEDGAVARVDLSALDVERGWNALHPQERAQLSPRARASRRRDFVGGRLAARNAARVFFESEHSREGPRDTLVLGRVHAPQKDAPEIYFAGDPPEKIPGVFVSISHAGDLAVSAISAGEVGIDLVVRGSVEDDLLPHLFQRAEIEWWERALGPAPLLANDVAFAAKECGLKILGEGLRIAPLDVTLAPNTHRRVGAASSESDESDNTGTWSGNVSLKREGHPPMELASRVCCRGTLVEVLLWVPVQFQRSKKI